MGDPTGPPRGSDDDQYQTDSGESDIDAEAEEIEPIASSTNTLNHQNDNRPRNQQYRANSNGNGQVPVSDTVSSILSSISRPEPALVIPIEQGNVEDETEIDAERMERFYNGALNAITKVCCHAILYRYYQIIFMHQPSTVQDILSRYERRLTGLQIDIKCD